MAKPFTEPAFPVMHNNEAYSGMDLRDYFAGQAMLGILASQHTEAWNNVDKAAEWAFEYADAMLEKRKS